VRGATRDCIGDVCRGVCELFGDCATGDKLSCYVSPSACVNYSQSIGCCQVHVSLSCCCRC
jgi:hypothetical protein